MSRATARRRAALVSGLLAPLVAGIVVAVVMVVAKDQRELQFIIQFPALVALAGLLVTLCASAVAWAAIMTSRRFGQGVAAGELAQRSSHQRFLARLDHELKNPITAIRAASAAAAEETFSGHLAVIDSQSARLTSLVADLRKLSSLETHELFIERIDFEQLANDAIATVTEQLEVAGDFRAFDVSFPRAPWPLAHIDGDIDLLFVAVYNLLSNATKFSPSGSRIEVRATEDDGGVVLEVSDTGMGIPPDEVAGIWDELARGSNARGMPGSGLGLSLVALVVARHGGSVALDSRLGQGTRVRVRLPASAASGDRHRSPS